MNCNRSAPPCAPRCRVLSLEEYRGLAWRRERGLDTLSDLMREYAAKRRPRGNYQIPLPGDLIEDQP